MGRDPKALTQVSKFLSLVLRHQPQSIGVTLDAHGWVEIDVLLAACRAHRRSISRELLEEVVETSPKRRFAISEDGRRIRASQGHSVEVDLAYEPATPPSTLYHGTVASVLAEIRAAGLSKMSRHHVHLSADVATARVVGKRRGAPVILEVDAGRMHREGHVFYVSANGVWLTEHVPVAYLRFPQR